MEQKTGRYPNWKFMLSIVLFSERKTWQNFSIVLGRCLQGFGSVYMYSLGFHAVNDVLDPVLHSFTRPHRPIRLWCLRSLLLSWNTEMKKMKKAMHGSDFAYQSKYEFYNVNLFWKQLKGSRNEINVFQVGCVVCQIITRMTKWSKNWCSDCWH